ncbi:uncharacterized protein NFIA_005020 [Aspergillus fischeri NRRL 181]|uniref:Uncharacterized protein n=1 Tax=Neosartorya fischeri (strain ATCC 1020 / DSM 3700 / CBS 544.65 / FGSC A1164 / JCM 1740 / NRRL 181 / WB 181) TaxID=331117 RepID=A1DKA3_NEOFI|nr:uncharacterized protein NFIA_005020 [Aspergillus fischeri NRRL 181]EAW17142.1 hypothetical protein NFIA_005020 [Aspergillus fischeri NRRL 181]KAG2001259.1 hypothetical protein GB937_010328 [Aspergillus fischeri]
MSVYVLHVEAKSVNQDDPRSIQQVQSAEQYLMQFAALASAQLEGFQTEYPNPHDTSALRERNMEFSIPDDLNLDIKRMAKDALERLGEFATFTIKDKVSGEKKNPFA